MSARHRVSELLDDWLRIYETVIGPANLQIIERGTFTYAFDFATDRELEQPSNRDSHAIAAIGFSKGEPSLA